MFSLDTLKGRLFSSVFFSLLGLLIVAAFGISQFHAQIRADREQTLRASVDIAVSTVRTFKDLAASGQLGVDEAQTRAKQALRGMRYLGNEYFYVYDGHGKVLMHPVKPELEGRDLWDFKDPAGAPVIRQMIEAARGNHAIVSSLWPRPGSTEPVAKLLYADYVDGWDWAVGSGLYADDLTQMFLHQLWGTLALIAVVLAVVGVTAWTMARSVFSRIGGEPAVAMEKMHQVAEGDLSVQFAQAPASSLLGALYRLVRALSETMRGIVRHAQAVDQAAEEISGRALEVADAASAETDAIQGMAAAMEELTVSIDHVAGNASETEQRAESAAELAQQGEADVQQTALNIEAMAQSMDTAAVRIRSLVANTEAVARTADTIRGIAGQTNLLALNAAIEAARAGEQGRGFAVVADEVRILAERTEKATIEISEVLQRIQDETRTAAQAVDEALPQAERARQSASQTSALLTHIGERSREARDLVREVAASVREQSGVSTSLAQQVERVAQQVEATSRNMHLTAEAAVALRDVAHGLNTTAAAYRV